MTTNIVSRQKLISIQSHTFQLVLVKEYSMLNLLFKVVSKVSKETQQIALSHWLAAFTPPGPGCSSNRGVVSLTVQQSLILSINNFMLIWPTFSFFCTIKVVNHAEHRWNRNFVPFCYISNRNTEWKIIAICKVNDCWVPPYSYD